MRKQLKWGLRSSPMTSLTAGCFKEEREKKKKETLDNHQCLQYLSSKRLKAHIAYNWIWFALPASVREIKGRHKNPHDSFSSRWQEGPNRSWKEYLWRKTFASPRAAASGSDGNGEQWWIIKTQIIKRRLMDFFFFLLHQSGKKTYFLPPGWRRRKKQKRINNLTRIPQQLKTRMWQ